MKRSLSLLLATALLALNSCQVTVDSDISRESPQELDYFQLKKYNYETQAQEALLDGYFRNLKLLFHLLTISDLHFASFSDISLE